MERLRRTNRNLLFVVIISILFNLILITIINEQNNKFDSLLEETYQKNEGITDLNKVIEYRNNDIKYLKLELKKLKQQLDEQKEVSRGAEFKQYIVEMTSYTAFCPEGCIGITKSGYDVSNTIYYKGHRVVAVDPNLIPLYSFLKVETANETFFAYALDTGGAIKGNIIDLLVETEEIARQNGRQKNVKVTILREGKGEEK